LYTPITVTMSRTARRELATSALLPRVIQRVCAGCEEQRQRWQLLLGNVGSKGLSDLSSPVLIAYQCRNCGVALFHVVLTVVE
jgi:hypothetical protein